MAYLEVVDAAETCVVEEADIDFLLLLYSCDEFAVHHVEASVSYEGVNFFLVSDCELNAESTGYLVSHRGISVFHVVCVNGIRTPHSLHVSRE